MRNPEKDTHREAFLVALGALEDAEERLGVVQGLRSALRLRERSELRNGLGLALLLRSLLLLRQPGDRVPPVRVLALEAGLAPARRLVQRLGLLRRHLNQILEVPEDVLYGGQRGKGYGERMRLRK